MAGEERFLSHQLNGVININGAIAFVESMKKSGGNPERKKIGINANGYIMEQSAEKNPIEYEGTLLAPNVNAKTFINTYKPQTVLTTFATTLDTASELTKAGDMEITDCDWDAAILENDVLKVTIKLKTLGYGATTTYSDGSGGGGT